MKMRVTTEPQKHRGIRFVFVFLCVFVSLCLTSLGHDIPADITLQSFLKPEGQTLHFLLRVPMKAMRDIEFPKRGPGYLELDRVEEYLRDGAEQWISNFTEIDENDVPLPKPKIVDARVSLESDKSFSSYEEAIAPVTGPRLPNNMDLH